MKTLSAFLRRWSILVGLGLMLGLWLPVHRWIEISLFLGGVALWIYGAGTVASSIENRFKGEVDATPIRSRDVTKGSVWTDLKSLWSRDP